MSGEAGHLTDEGDKWVRPKHPFVAGDDGRCMVCNQPESNAGHPPLPEEAPPYATSEEQMEEAVGNMRRMFNTVQQVDRTGWTRAQWVAEAEVIMDDIDGSVLALLNGHVLAMLEELRDLRRRNESSKALRTFDMQTVLRTSPVINAAQNWLTAREEAADGAGVADIPGSENFLKSMKATEALEQAVWTYNAIIETEEAGGA